MFVWVFLVGWAFLGGEKGVFWVVLLCLGFVFLFFFFVVVGFSACFKELMFA